MAYLSLFIEGIITFISPCLLPMLPIYILYFAGDNPENKRKRTLINAVGFVLGFTIVFTILGAFAGFLGGFLVKYQRIINIVSGLILIIFGLNYLGVFNVGFLNRVRSASQKPVKIRGFSSALVFGILFSISWTPCVGAFLTSALALASQRGSVIQGIFMLLAYSMGLGLPLILSALLINQLKSAFDFIKRHYNIINKISGGMLVLLGIFMMTGHVNKWLSALSRFSFL